MSWLVGACVSQFLNQNRHVGCVVSKMLFMVKELRSGCKRVLTQQFA